MKDVNFLEFVKKYMKFAILIAIVLFFAFVKDVISFKLLACFAAFVLILFAPAYAEWTDDMKNAALDAYCYRSQQIVADFIFKKMQEDVLNSRVGIDFEKNVQFYGIAIYKIPRDLYIDIRKDH